MEMRLHHVGVIVQSESHLNQLLELFGLPVLRRHFVAEYQAECVFAGHEGAVVEFILPREGKLKKFNRGVGGTHHLAFEVPSLKALQEELRARKIELLEPEPVDAGPIRINFLSPIYTRGVIVEFVEKVTSPEKTP